MYADHYSILSNSQKGLRNTMRQLHTLVNVLADAKLSEQNLFMIEHASQNPSWRLIDRIYGHL